MTNHLVSRLQVSVKYTLSNRYHYCFVFKVPTEWRQFSQVLEYKRVAFYELLILPRGQRKNVFKVPTEWRHLSQVFEYKKIAFYELLILPRGQR